MREPILVLGMHRSGTSFVARTLERLGVFMGADLDPNHESRLFLELDQFALNQCGARWDQPERVGDLLGHPELRRVIREHFRYMVHSPLMRRYTGTRFRSVEAAMERLGKWGWKDPRTVLLLPIWLEVFPGARLLHVRRHGVDVAASLRTRHRNVLAHTLELLDHDDLYDWKAPYRPLVDTVRASSLRGGFELWEHYMAIAAEHLDGLDALELRYEDMATDPERAVGELAKFLGLEPSTEELAAIAANADAGRALAYRDDPELVAFAADLTARLSRHGYGTPDAAAGEPAPGAALS